MPHRTRWTPSANPQPALFPLVEGITNYQLVMGDHLRNICSFASSVSTTLTVSVGPNPLLAGIIFTLTPSTNPILLSMLSTGSLIQSSMGAFSQQTLHPVNGMSQLCVGVSNQLVLINPSS